MNCDRVLLQADFEQVGVFGEEKRKRNGRRWQKSCAELLELAHEGSTLKSRELLFFRCADRGGELPRDSHCNEWRTRGIRTQVDELHQVRRSETEVPRRDVDFSASLYFYADKVNYCWSGGGGEKRVKRRSPARTKTFQQESRLLLATGFDHLS